jgi:hypothetical protein
MRMSTNKKIIVACLAIAALSLVPVMTLGANATTTTSAAAQTIFPKGTVCGDAQAGPWRTSQFNGVSNYLGFHVLFTVNNLVLSGGDSGTVKSPSGTIQVSRAGHTVLAASFTNLVGKYTIKGNKMTVAFKMATLDILLDTLVNLQGNFNNPMLPSANIPCGTLDTFQ